MTIKYHKLSNHGRCFTLSSVTLRTVAILYSPSRGHTVHSCTPETQQSCYLSQVRSSPEIGFLYLIRPNRAPRLGPSAVGSPSTPSFVPFWLEGLHLASCLQVSLQIESLGPGGHVFLCRRRRARLPSGPICMISIA